MYQSHVESWKGSSSDPEEEMGKDAGQTELQLPQSPVRTKPILFLDFYGNVKIIKISLSVATIL